MKKVIEKKDINLMDRTSSSSNSQKHSCILVASFLNHVSGYTLMKMFFS